MSDASRDYGAEPMHVYRSSVDKHTRYATSIHRRLAKIEHKQVTLPQTQRNALMRESGKCGFLRKLKLFIIL